MENKNFFNPYAYVNQNLNSNPVPPPPFPLTSQSNTDMPPPIITPREYYEQQYMYYRCLNEMMDFSIKKRQFENSGNENKK